MSSGEKHTAAEALVPGVDPITAEATAHLGPQTKAASPKACRTRAALPPCRGISGRFHNPVGRERKGKSSTH